MTPGNCPASWLFITSKFKKMKKSKIALITGGSRGLGKDMALRLAEKGLHVIITYNSSVEDAKKVVAQVEASGQMAAALQLNTGVSRVLTALKLNLNQH